MFTERGTWSHRWGSRCSSAKRDRCAMPATGDNRPRPGDISEVKFLTVAEVAATMRVSKMTVYRLVHAGTLPAVRVGRSFRVPEQAVHDYLRQSYVDTA